MSDSDSNDELSTVIIGFFSSEYSGKKGSSLVLLRFIDTETKRSIQYKIGVIGSPIYARVGCRYTEKIGFLFRGQKTVGFQSEILSEFLYFMIIL